jgi:hypothetical protein
MIASKADEVVEREHAARDEVKTERTAPGWAPEKSEAAPSAAEVAFTGTSVATEIGGVLYLINVMRRLALPSCCEAGWNLAGQVSAWGVLELLGRALLRASEATDPIWRALATLDGRAPDTLPGQTYRREGDGVLPAGWELPARTGAAWPPGAHPLLAGLNPELEAWLAAVVPVVSRRLLAALALPDAAQLRPALLMVPGRLYVTRSHVDLVSNLAAISLPARRAGLDANPGWQPDFGRIISFHFR